MEGLISVRGEEAIVEITTLGERHQTTIHATMTGLDIFLATKGTSLSIKGGMIGSCNRVDHTQDHATAASPPAILPIHGQMTATSNVVVTRKITQLTSRKNEAEMAIMFPAADQLRAKKWGDLLQERCLSGHQMNLPATLIRGSFLEPAEIREIEEVWITAGHN